MTIFSTVGTILGTTDILLANAAISITNATPLPGQGTHIEVTGLPKIVRAFYIFEGDLDETGNFEKLSANHTADRARGASRDYMTIHAYQTPGLKNISVRIRSRFAIFEPLVLTAQINVQDQDTVFDAAHTFVVRESGTDTDYPTTSRPIYADIQAAMNGVTALNDDAPVRICVQRGSDYKPTDDLEIDYRRAVEFYFDTWGAGARPRIDCSDFGVKARSRGAPFTFSGFEMYGNWNPQTGENNTGTAFDLAEVSTSETGVLDKGYSVFDCYIHNLTTGYAFSDVRAEESYRQYIIDTEIYACKFYQIFMANLGQGGVRGCKIWQDPLAVNADDGRSPDTNPGYGDHYVRIAIIHLGCVVQNIEGFNNVGHSDWNDPGDDLTVDSLRSHQAFRFGSTTATGGSLVVSGIFAEGTGISLAGSSNNGISSQMEFCLIARNYLAGQANAGGSISIGHSNVWVMCNIGIVPSVLDESTNPRGLVDFQAGNDSTDANFTDGTIHFGYNTFIQLQTAAQYRDTTINYDDIIRLPEFVAAGITPTFENNVVHIPNMTMDGEAGPRDSQGPLSTALTGMTPLYVGQRRKKLNGDPAVTLLQFATPPDAFIEACLDSTSPAADAVTEYEADRVAYDFNNDLRPKITPQGAQGKVAA